jgi:hypothetical protein
MRALMLATLLAAPLALAGTTLPTTPAGMYCVVQNADECTAGPFAGLTAPGMAFYGAYAGTLTMTLDGGGFHHTLVCRSILAAVTWLDPATLFGTCDHIGAFPPAGVELVISCRSEGIGIALCAVSGP